jgi:hypothetical protein
MKQLMPEIAIWNCSGGSASAASGADLTFAIVLTTHSQSERQIQSSTRINILLVVP